jgi:hypothetical protein
MELLVLRIGDEVSSFLRYVSGKQIIIGLTGVHAYEALVVIMLLTNKLYRSFLRLLFWCTRRP